MTLEPEDKDSDELFRAAIGGGAGLLRTYSISGGGVEPSLLSHSLSPLSLVTADFEVRIPGVGLSIALGGAFRPVRYELGFALDPEDRDPRGALIDAYGQLGYQIGISGAGLQTYKIIPRVGARFGYYTVQDHPGNAVLTAQVVSVGGGLAARMPINEVLEINAGVDGGALISYSENPTNSGDPGIGFSIVGALGVRIWVIENVAISFDNTFTFESISFSGEPTRDFPGPERGQVVDARITTRDLRTSIGVAFRL